MKAVGYKGKVKVPPGLLGLVHLRRLETATATTQTASSLSCLDIRPVS